MKEDVEDRPDDPRLELNESEDGDAEFLQLLRNDSGTFAMEDRDTVEPQRDNGLQSASLDGIVEQGMNDDIFPNARYQRCVRHEQNDPGGLPQQEWVHQRLATQLETLRIAIDLLNANIERLLGFTEEFDVSVVQHLIQKIEQMLTVSAYQGLTPTLETRVQHHTWRRGKRRPKFPNGYRKKQKKENSEDTIDASHQNQDDSDDTVGVGGVSV